MASLLFPMPLSCRQPLRIASIGGKRAFWAGGAQVGLRASAGGSGTRPYRNYSGLSGERRRGRSQTGPPGIVESQSGASGRPRPTERLAKSGRPRCAAPTEENGPRALARPCLKIGNVPNSEGFFCQTRRFDAAILGGLQGKSTQYGGKRPAVWMR